MFLDEIGDMPMEAQTRLLRVLQQGEYTTVGGRTPIKTDVRIIAATNKDLRYSIQQGSFREDLFFRLNVVPLRLPPLRERTEDIRRSRRAISSRKAWPKACRPSVSTRRRWSGFGAIAGPAISANWKISRAASPRSIRRTTISEALIETELGLNAPLQSLGPLATGRPFRRKPRADGRGGRRDVLLGDGAAMSRSCSVHSATICRPPASTTACCGSWKRR